MPLPMISERGDTMEGFVSPNSKGIHLKRLHKHEARGVALGICSPVTLEGRAIWVNVHELNRGALTFGYLGDSDENTVRELEKTIVPLSSRETEEITEEGKVILPPLYDYRTIAIGQTLGMMGRLDMAAKILSNPEVFGAINDMIEATRKYSSLFGKDFISLFVGSLGGTELFNTVLRYLAFLKLDPVYTINTWIIDYKHPNLKPVISFRLKSGIPEKELVVLRENKRQIKEEDYIYARFLCDILQFPVESGQSDVSTILERFKREGNRIVNVEGTTVYVPLRKIIIEREKKVFFGLRTKIEREEEFRKDQDIMVKNLGKAIELLSKSEPEHDWFGIYIIHAPISHEEFERIREGAKIDTDAEIFYIPAAGRCVNGEVECTVLRAWTSKYSNRIINKIFGLKGIREAESPENLVPSDVLEKASKVQHVENGFKEAAKYLNIDTEALLGGEIS